MTDAVQAAARVSDPRLATIYDTDFDEQCPYIVAEWRARAGFRQRTTLLRPAV